jgi:hypothetical protein
MPGQPAQALHPNLVKGYFGEETPTAGLPSGKTRTLMHSETKKESTVRRHADIYSLYTRLSGILTELVASRTFVQQYIPYPKTTVSCSV